MLFKSLAAAAIVGVASAVEVTPVRVGMAANGTAGFFFSPDTLTVPVGAMVQFQFVGGNHTVTQSNFDAPCIPLSTSNTSAVGLHSDYVPAAASIQQSGEIPIWTIQINNTNPIWLYCAQGQHCQSGMSMVINPPANNADRTLENYRAGAVSVAQSQVPSGNGGAPAGGQPGNQGGGAGGNQDPAQPAAAAGLRVPAALLAMAAGAAFFM